MAVATIHEQLNATMDDLHGACAAVKELIENTSALSHADLKQAHTRMRDAFNALARYEKLIQVKPD